MSEFYLQAPDEVLDYQIVWQNYLDEGESILTSSWSASTDLTITGASVDGNFAYCTIAGGTLGKRYQILNVIETSGGQTHSVSIFIYVEVK